MLQNDKPELTPARIRAIRQRLGLSQVEAGELLGGGPRAFTKYESGTVRPAAAVANLIRVLEAHPSVIATLRGHTPSPMVSNSGIRPLEVTGQHIGALNERLFPQLLRRLLVGEAHTNNLPMDGIHVASSFATPDGGEDGYIEWTGGPGRTDFLPCRRNQFQMKCGRISPARAGQDVLTDRGTGKDMVRRVIEAGGCYVVLSNQPYVRQKILTREARIRDALQAVGMTLEDRQVQFRDADQIATWANSHPAVATWIKERTQPGTVGPFHSWAHWAGRPEHDRPPWIEDERLKPLRERMEQVIAETQGVIRLVGLSGIGKSRLALEALAPDDNVSLSDIVLYADESEPTPADIKNAVQGLADGGDRAVIVVDHCTPETRRTLVGMVLRQSSRLSLVTIEDEIPSGTLGAEAFEIEEAPPSVVEQIVTGVSPGLPSEDKRRLVRFSRGFPEMAISVARAWVNSVPVAHATEDDLVDAFVCGRDPLESTLLIKSAQLLAVFGLVGTDHALSGQLEEVTCFGRGLDADDLRAGVQRLVDRRVVQRRGRLVVLQPRPIALRLAERQWKEWGCNRWDAVLAGDTSPSLKVSAARQLALLNTTKISMRVVDHLCRIDGPLDGLQLLSDHAEVLSALIEIAPYPVIDLLERSLGDVEDLANVQGDTRRHLVSALEKAAFRADTFEDAARLLMQLAVAENENYADDATGVFNELFPLLLGKTAADGKSRLAFLDEMSTTTNLAQLLIVIEALTRGARTESYQRTVGAETHGLRPALDSWTPKTVTERTDYIEGCVKRLGRFAELDDDTGRSARTGLAENLRSLVSHGFIDIVEKVVERVRNVLGLWTEAMAGLSHFLEFDVDEAGTELSDRVRALTARLQPQELEARARFLLSAHLADFPSCSDTDFKAREEHRLEEIRQAASELVKRPRILRCLLSTASQHHQPMARCFGECIARAADSPLDWLEPVKQALLQVSQDHRNPDLLAGFLVGIAEKYPEVVDGFKQQLAHSPELAPVFPRICWHLGIKSADVSLVISALRAELLPPAQLEHWTVGRKLNSLPSTAVATLVNVMLDHSSTAFLVAVNLMAMYVYGNSDMFDSLQPQVRRVAENVTRWRYPRFEVMSDFYFEQLMRRILVKGRKDSDACAIARTLARAFCKTIGSPSARLVEPLLPTLLSDFPEIAWPLIGQKIISTYPRSWILEYSLRQRPHHDSSASPLILNLPEETLFAWCQAHLDQAPAFAAATVPVLTDESGKPQPLLHPVMMRLIDEFGHCSGVLEGLERNMDTFTWIGSATSRLQLYREPLGVLQDHPIDHVRRWAKSRLRDLDAEIEHVRSRDEEFEAQHEI